MKVCALAALPGEREGKCEQAHWSSGPLPCEKRHPLLPVCRGSEARAVRRHRAGGVGNGGATTAQLSATQILEENPIDAVFRAVPLRPSWSRNC